MVRTEPSSSSPCAAEPSTPCEAAESSPLRRECRDKEAVHFNLESLTRFQGIRGMGEGQQPTPLNSVNFRKRPHYNGSRRKLSRAVQERRPQLTFNMDSVVATAIFSVFCNVFESLGLCSISKSDTFSSLETSGMQTMALVLHVSKGW